MIHVRNVLSRLVAVGVAGAALIGVSGAAASAAPTSVPLSAMSVQVFASCPKWSNPVPASGAIINGTNIGLGVFHLADGACAKGAYDVVLPKGQDTYHYFGWREAAGVYIGNSARVVVVADGQTSEPVTGPGWITRSWGGNWTVKFV